MKPKLQTQCDRVLMSQIMDRLYNRLWGSIDGRLSLYLNSHFWFVTDEGTTGLDFSTDALKLMLCKRLLKDSR